MDKLRVGAVLYGYCSGYFGKESLHEKRIEAIGADWVVVRDEYGELDFAEFRSTEHKYSELTSALEKEEDDQGVT